MKLPHKRRLQRERQIVATINEGVGKYEPLGKGRAFVASDTLRPEQKEAVLKALANRDLAFNINGAAGVGKTYTLKELDRGLKEARVKSYGSRAIGAGGASATKRRLS